MIGLFAERDSPPKGWRKKAAIIAKWSGLALLYPIVTGVVKPNPKPVLRGNWH
jgi:hypothetical protein